MKEPEPANAILNPVFVHALGFRGDAVLRDLVDVVAHAIEVFGDRTKALRWLRTPIPSLNDETPQEMLESEGGIERVEDVLGRIEHGVW